MHLRPCGQCSSIPLNMIYILVTKGVMTITNAQHSPPAHPPSVNDHLTCCPLTSEMSMQQCHMSPMCLHLSHINISPTHLHSSHIHTSPLITHPHISTHHTSTHLPQSPLPTHHPCISTCHTSTYLTCQNFVAKCTLTQCSNAIMWPWCIDHNFPTL
jgi:hypothetical protein